MNEALSDLRRRAIASTKQHFSVTRPNWDWVNMTGFMKQVRKPFDPSVPLTLQYELVDIELIERGNYFKEREGAD